MDEAIKAVMDGATVLEMHDNYMLVMVDDVELFVGARVAGYGCECCGTYGTLDVSYNRPEDYRIEHHGEADPLGIL
jgi:hypothetical protein